MASSSVSPVCFYPPRLPLQAWRAQVAPGLGSCLPQACQGAATQNMDTPRSLSERRQAPKTPTTNTVSDEPPAELAASLRRL